MPTAGFRPQAALAVVVFVFTLALACQWQGFQSLPGTDAIAYITAGVNLVRTGQFTNPFGQPELWFPPLYPILIGLLSGGGYLDPVLVARLLSAVFGILTVVLLGGFCDPLRRFQRYAGVAAAAVLAANPIFQLSATQPLSECVATALAASAFAVWAAPPRSATARRFCCMGVLVGLSELTRPEGLILLPLWAGVDLFLQRSWETLAKYAVAGLACLAIIAPYSAWLYSHTGHVSLSGKMEVNLASGRATYFRTPREYIDPASLEMRYWPHEVGVVSEARRYVVNCARILKGYSEWFGGPLGAGLLPPLAIGTLALIGRREWRLLGGLSAFLAELPVLAAFEVKTRYLDLTLPALAAVAGIGSVVLLEASRRSERAVGRWAAVILLGWFVLGLSDGVSRNPRETLSGALPSGVTLRDAGVRMREIGLPAGVVYETWSLVAFHSRQLTRKLTSDDLDTILRFIDVHEPIDTPVYLIASTVESAAYHPSVAGLLSSGVSRPNLEQVVELFEPQGAVVVYRVRHGQEYCSPTSPAR